MKRTYIWTGLVSLAVLLGGIYIYMTYFRAPAPRPEAPIVETQEITTTEGFSLLVAPYDPSMGQTLMQRKTWKPALLKLLPNLINAHSKILNLGANTGFLDLYIARLLPAEGKGMIMAFEGAPSLVTLLNMNIQKQGYEKLIYVYPIAAADKEAHLSFCYKEVDPKLVLSSPLCDMIRTVPLDSLTLETPTLVIATIEGSEVAAILGAQKLLERAKHPPLILAWDPPMLKAKGADVAAFIKFLKAARYNAYEITGDRQNVNLIPLSFSTLEREVSKRDLLIRRE